MSYKLQFFKRTNSISWMLPFTLFLLYYFYYIILQALYQHSIGYCTDFQHLHHT